MGLVYDASPFGGAVKATDDRIADTIVGAVLALPAAIENKCVLAHSCMD